MIVFKWYQMKFVIREVFVNAIPQLTAQEDALLACTPTEELLLLDMLRPENIKDTLHAYQMAKHCNEKFPLVSL